MKNSFLTLSKRGLSLCFYAPQKTLLLLIFTASTSLLLAQSPETEWSTSGNIADTNSFIGTQNAACLRLNSNNQERMRISADGNIGIGTKEPVERLDVEGNISLTGDLIFKGEAYHTDSTKQVLMLNEYGKTEAKGLGNFLSDIYAIDCYMTTEENPTRAVVGLTLPSWANRIADDRQILYTGLTCPTSVGIGTNLPMTLLDVRGNGRFTGGLRIGNNYEGYNAAFYIENKSTAGHTYFDYLMLVKNASGQRVLQLEENGLLRTREVKVDVEAWPDYVFHDHYNLMPLNEVKDFINQHGHLPNVPSAKEIEENGVNLGESAKISLEKIEELTLYLFELNERLNEQEKSLIEKETVIEQQQEIIQLQKELIQKLENRN
ncbi:MAG: hypothetical protein M9897_13510 [Brumimicrobium sp.]|nr:hypothetical protein [Brumimicrobium sp.]